MKRAWLRWGKPAIRLHAKTLRVAAAIVCRRCAMHGQPARSDTAYGPFFHHQFDAGGKVRQSSCDAASLWTLFPKGAATQEREGAK